MKTLIEHDGCKGCRYENYGAETPVCNGCKQNSTDKYTRMTNADLIRSMSDEELAVTIMCPNETGHAEIKCTKEDKCSCTRCCFEWLQKEIKTDKSDFDNGWGEAIHKMVN